MIYSVLIFNNDALPRLMKFYTPIDLETQMLLVRQVYQLVSKRSDKLCSFLTPPPLLEELDDIRIIYRRYAAIYFVFIVDEQESELGIYDLIQMFVECLDVCFKNVCELDLVFGWQLLESVLEEMIQGGLVVDTNWRRIVDAVDYTNAGNDGILDMASKTFRTILSSMGSGAYRPIG